MKKVFLTLMVMVLITSISFATFSDLPDGHWAKATVEEMVEAGIISGYTDGTFRPSKEISKIESLILLSRIAGLNKYPTEAAKYLETYTSTLAPYTTQYKKDVAYLLGVGVLKEKDLSNLLSSDKVNSPLTREEMAVLVTKVLGKEEEATKNSIVVLPFSDTSSISAAAKPYVYYVYTQGIMAGMSDSTFSPKTALTRAQAATVLQRIYKKVNIKPANATTTPTPTPTGSSSVTSFVTGTITKIDTSANSVWIKTTTGTEEYEYDNNTKFYVSGRELSSDSMKVNATVTATISGDTYIASMNITDGAKVSTKTVKGTIYAASSAAKTITITTDGSRITYNYDASTTFTLDGKSSTLAGAIKKDYAVTLTVDAANYITKAAVTSPDERIIGKITAVSTKYGYVVFEDDDDEEYILMDDEIDNYSKSYKKSSEDYYFDDDTDFKYNGSSKKYSSIATTSYLYKTGNYIAITPGKNEYIDLIEVATKKATLTGSNNDDDDDDSDEDLIGKITAVSTKYGYVVIEDVDKGKEYILMDDVINNYDASYEDEDEDYYFNKSTDFSYEGSSKKYSAIATTSYLYKKGNYVGLVLGKNDYIEEIKIASKESKLTGSSSSSSSYSSEDMIDDNYLVGKITDIDDDFITIEADDGEEYDIDVLSTAIVMSYDTKKPSSSSNYASFEDAYDDDDIGKGDRVLVVLYKEDQTALIILL